jgi:hypothetical protein
MRPGSARCLSLIFLSLIGVRCVGEEAALPPDPLLAPAEQVSGLTDVSADLAAVLEHGALQGACAKMQPGDPRSRLLCGKSMFFYETFGTAGVPAGLLRFLLDNFPEELGPGFEKLGLIADPNSPAHLPLGFSPTAKIGGKVDALAFTCASCHFARLPDGKYSVGAPNSRYQYGKQNLSLMLFPAVALNGPAGHDEAALAAIAPLINRYKADSSLKNKLLLAILPLALSGTMAPAFPIDAEAKYASWRPGTQDFFIEPLPINDGVHIVSKISPLWELPTAQEVQRSGMTSALLGWTGNAPGLMEFCQTFVLLGGGPPASWPKEKLAPLVEYIYSLRRPENPAPPDPELASRGRRLFVERGCLSCHDGPRGSGKRVYTYDELGTDRAMERWLSPDLGPTACCGVPTELGELTHGLKSPRLVGAWATGSFLHNGSVDSLEQLFCLSGPRPTRSDAPFGDQGHDETCTGLGDAEKRALIAYLLAN